MASQFSGGNPRSTARSAGTVLVVEDDPAVRYSLQFSLEAEGYSVRLFANAGSLLADPDLPGHGCIVADYFLPDGNGLELILMLRGRGARPECRRRHP